MLFKKGNGHSSPFIPEPKHANLGSMRNNFGIKSANFAPKQHIPLKQRLFANKTKGQIAWAVFKWIIAPKNWKLIIIFFPLLLTTTKLLREDHIKMTQLRDAVIAADAEEDDEKLEASLNELKNFVFNNIVVNVVDRNGDRIITFGTGPFYLEHLYTRAASDALFLAANSFENDDNPNGNIYKEASLTCKERAIKNHWSWDNPNFINCMTTEIAKYPSAEEITDELVASIPPTDLYRRNYASPAWAPTTSGWCLLGLAAIVVVIFIRIIIWIIYGIALLFV